MKKLTVLAALVMATTSAHAGNSISFEIDGHKVRIEAPNNCDQLSCVRISGFDFKGFNSNSFNSKNFNSKNFNGDDDAAATPEPPAQRPAPAPAIQFAPATPAAAPQAPAAPLASPAPAPAAVASTPPAPATDVAPPAPAAVQAGATPLGVWATEENKGNVRIEPCGQNLCGYAVKTGEKILINMKPHDTKWTGQIHDPDSGRNYDSTIAMKGANSLRVQGCAFGGMFCGGQVWNRVS